MRNWFRGVFSSSEPDSLDGTSLQFLIKRRRKFPLRYKLEIIAKVADALQQVHQKSLLHRDVKPANILLTKEGVPELADSGIARLQAEPDAKGGILIGTIAYMSPEQVRGEQIDARSDIWALGATLYEWLAFVRPLAAENIAQEMFNIVSRQPAPLRDYVSDAPEALQAIITRALQKNPADRYQTAEEVARDLRALARNLPPN